MTAAPDILVVGAGPTGLALALQACDHGARVRIVERRLDTFRPSRALIMHPRTLEALRPLGVIEPLLERVKTTLDARIRLKGRTVQVSLAQLALPDTEFPHLSLARQADIEAVLARALAERGVPVERGTELVAVHTGPQRAAATLRSDAGVEEIDAGFVAGCDGQQSTVRASARIRWRGGPYREEVLLADVDLDRGFDGGAQVVASRGGLVFLFPLGEQAAWRLLATQVAEDGDVPYGGFGPPVPADQLQQLLDLAGLDARITHLAWSARVGVQHRLASRFRHGRLFLVGDAAHAFSPATGQGMNTGIQDALNLGWKLAFAGNSGNTGNTENSILLDSYELERRPVAMSRLLLTHAAFWAEASTAPLPSWLRSVAAPAAAPILPLLLGRRRLVAHTVRTLSQLRIHYRGSPLSMQIPAGLGGSPRAGDRVPDTAVIADGQPRRVHDLLAGPGIHLLTHTDAPPLTETGFGPYVSVCTLDSTPGCGLLAVRPDGYVGLRCAYTDTAALGRWLALVGAPTARR